MHRRVFRPGAAALVAVAFALTGCTGSDGAAVGADPKTGGVAGSPTAVPSGKYGFLPEACVAVERNQLRALLPVTDTDGKNTAAAKAREEALLGGKPALTFDTDRRVGCSWQRTSVTGSRHLRIDFERVVSYDASTSDEVRATQVFARKAQEHGVSTRDLTKGPQTGGSPDPDAELGEMQATESGGPGADDPALMAPRRLEKPGDEAFLDEKAGTADSGARRVVTVIFRTANVVVTVVYGQSTTDPTELPDAAELQGKALELADKLGARFTG